MRIGDRFSVGTAEVVVTQPRLPCYKLGIRFGNDEMVKWFLASGRTGFYLAVSREGEVAADPDRSRGGVGFDFNDHTAVHRERVQRRGSAAGGESAGTWRVAG